METPLEPSRKVIVTGATGFIGGALAARLAAAGLNVRCLARRGSDTSGLETAGLECVEGDLLDKPLAEGGLALSRYTASAALFAFIVVCLLLSTTRAASRAH